MDSKLPAAYATHTVNILRVSAGHRKAALSALEDLEGDIVRKIEKASTINKQARLNALLDQTRGSISQTYAAIADGHGKDLRDLAAVESTFTRKSMGAAIGADVFGVAVSANQLEKAADGKTIFGHSSAEWWKNQDTALQYKFRGTMQQGFLAGETNDELVRRVRGTKANNFNDGVMSASRRDATALVRTAAISTANSARLATLEAMQDVVKGVMWVATLDGRTTLICRALSGKSWGLPDYQPIGHDKAFPGPTAHWNCRSTQVPVLRSWEELSGRKLPSVGDQELEDAVRAKLEARGMSQKQLDAVTVRTRASMDGQVPENLTMDDWLAGKSDSFIDETLGPGRAKLWDGGNGKINLTDMTDQSNRPVSLKQLQELVESGTPLPETFGVEYLVMAPDGAYVATATTAALEATASAAIQGIARTLAAGAELSVEQQEVYDALGAEDKRRLRRMVKSFERE